MAGLVAAPFDPIYAANKHAVVGLARSLGPVYEPEGIRVHALCPSFAYTNIIKGSEQTLLDMGFPIIDVADVVDAFQRILDSEGTASAGTSSPVGRASPSASATHRDPGSTEVPEPGSRAPGVVPWATAATPTGDGSRRGAAPRTAARHG